MLTDFQAIMPVLIVTLSAIVTMVAEAFQPKQERAPLAGFGVLGLIGAAAASALLWGYDKSGFGVVRADNFSLFINLIVIAVGLLTILFSTQVIEREGIPPGEYYALTLFGVVGMMLMAAATDLLLLFLALEVLSLAVYVLTGIRRSQPQGAEGAFKYFLLGSFSSAFLLYGVALTYAIVGSTRLEEVAAALAGQTDAPNMVLFVAIGLLAVGFAFKVSAVPFHMWAPDAYEGAPTLVTGFMATGVKAAAFAAFLRVFLSSLQTLHESWAPMLWVIAVATMILGTVVGVVQSNAKRMLAYSSVAHAGYLLIGLITGTQTGEAATLFYLATYAVSTIGAFAVVALLADEQHPHDRVQDFAGLWGSRPGLAALMTVFLLSLGGFPPLAGFVGKWYIFSAAVEAGYLWLAIIGVLTSVISVFFYLRIVVMMYMSDETAYVQTPALARSAVAGLVLALMAVFYLGLLPTRAIDLALTSVQGMF